VKAFNISGIDGDVNSGGVDISSLPLGNPNYIDNIDLSVVTVIDVSGLTNLPSRASVVLFAYANTDHGPEFINMHDFMIYTATPSTAGQNICGGNDFNGSWAANVTNITVYSSNNFLTTVFPANTVIWQALDAIGGSQG